MALASSRWSLSRWLLLGRVIQLLGTLLTAIMNGFLLVTIHKNQLGLAASMYSLELMACIAFLYSAVVLLSQHTGNRLKGTSTPLIAAFVVGDVVFNGVAVAIITVLAYTGLPTDCHGLTNGDLEEPSDASNKLEDGFQTPGFGNEDTDTKGMLDKYCNLERSFYYIAVSLVFTYMLTGALGLLRIFERRWMEKGSVDPLFVSTDNVYQLDQLGPKTHNLDRSQDSVNAGPSSEGIISSTSPPSPTSLASPVSPTSRTTPTLQIQGVVSSEDLHRNRTFHQQSQAHPAPISPVSPASPISQVSPISPVTHSRGSLMVPPNTLDVSAGNLMRAPSPDAAAEAAITDGYRHHQHPRMPSLPPYSPGSSRGQFMEGHGDESNEMRLSEYVKGETRAQNMKDSGMGS